MFDKRKFRFLLRKGERNFISESMVTMVLRLKKEKAKELLKELENQGYIELFGIKNRWRVAMRGKVLAHETFEKVYKVESIRKHLDLLIERVDFINSSRKFPYSIGKIRVLGEYPIKNRSNGIRIVYTLVKKKLSEEEFDKIASKLRAKSKRHFYNYVEYLLYPETATYEALKSRSHILKLRKVEEKEMDVIPGHILFDCTTNLNRKM